jgi:ABC-type uncharacterized transport system auxiliary subunit
MGGGSAKRGYFSLEAPSAQQVRPNSETPYPLSIRVRRFRAALAYDRQEMVYRANPYELSFDWYRLWVAKPAKMLHELTVSALRDANLATEVTTSVGDRLPDFELDCEVVALEELDSAEQNWYAHLALHCSLVRFSDNAIVWEQFFDDKKQVFERQPIFVVRAMSDLFAQHLRGLVEAVEPHLAEATPGGAPVLRARPVDSAAPAERPTPAGQPERAATSPATAVESEQPAPPRPEPKARLKR